MTLVHLDRDLPDPLGLYRVGSAIYLVSPRAAFQNNHMSILALRWTSEAAIQKAVTIFWLFCNNGPACIIMISIHDFKHCVEYDKSCLVSSIAANIYTYMCNLWSCTVLCIHVHLLLCSCHETLRTTRRNRNLHQEEIWSYSHLGMKAAIVQIVLLWSDQAYYWRQCEGSYEASRKKGIGFGVEEFWQLEQNLKLECTFPVWRYGIP